MSELFSEKIVMDDIKDLQDEITALQAKLARKISLPKISDLVKRLRLAQFVYPTIPENPETLFKEAAQCIEELETYRDSLGEYQYHKEQVRYHFARFWQAQGCDCCADTEAIDLQGRILADLLDIPMYDDDSGVNYWAVLVQDNNEDI